MSGVVAFFSHATESTVVYEWSHNDACYICNMRVYTENLCGGKFHNHLRDVFAPQVVRYVDLMESSIAQSIHKGFEKENWKIQG